MKEIFNNTINSVIFSSAIALIVGLVMIFFPAITIETVGMIAASYIILHGIMLIYLDIKAYKYNLPFDGLIIGIVSILLGIFLICKPKFLPLLFTIVIGIWMILTSIDYIKIAIRICKTNLPWVLILLLGLLDLIAGIVVVFNPFEATISITLFAGIMLVIHSIINIVDMLIIKKDVKDISKEIEKTLKLSNK